MKVLKARIKHHKKKAITLLVALVCGIPLVGVIQHSHASSDHEPSIYS